MRRELLGTPVDILDFDATVKLARRAMAERKQCVHVALNVAKFVKLQDDPELRSDVHQGNIVGVDGMGIAWGLKLLGGYDVPRVTGVDLMMALLEECARSGRRPFLLGAKPDVLERATKNARSRWPDLDVAGSHHGYFNAGEEADIVRKINESNADCLFLAMPTPKKERFMAAHSKQLAVPFIMGVGGSVDILAGKVSRAPKWMQRSGLEWLYRLYQEPRKMFARYASTNGRFVWILLRAKLAGKGRKDEG